MRITTNLTDKDIASLHLDIKEILDGPLLSRMPPGKLNLAGRSNTWLEVHKKENGALALSVNKNVDPTNSYACQTIKASEFILRSRRPAPDTNTSEELSMHLHALGLVAATALDAWDDMELTEGDLFTQCIEQLCVHIPWLEHAQILAYRISPDKGEQLLGQWLYHHDILRDLTYEPRSQSTLDPFLRVQLLLSLHRSVHTQDKDGLYAIKSPGNATSYMLQLPPDEDGLPPTANTKESHTFWLDQNMQPLCINAERSSYSKFMVPTSTEMPWEVDKPHQATVEQWNAVLQNACPKTVPYESLRHGTPHLLSHQETLGCIEQWLISPTLSLGKETVLEAWESTANSLIFRYAMWATDTWLENYPGMKSVCEGLLPAWNYEPKADDIEIWRTTLGSMHSALGAGKIEKSMLPVDLNFIV